MEQKPTAAEALATSVKDNGYFDFDGTAKNICKHCSAEYYIFFQSF